jgi:microcystin-dependent protein
LEPFVGMIALFPYNFSPVGWMECLGQKLSIQQNAALYALIGSQFGGDNQTSFNLPNLSGKAPAPGMKYHIAINGFFPSRD